MSFGSQLSNPGSSSVNPDLDWSQIKETISMLCLAMAQIETTLTDSSKSVTGMFNTWESRSCAFWASRAFLSASIWDRLRGRRSVSRALSGRGSLPGGARYSL